MKIKEELKELRTKDLKTLMAELNSGNQKIIKLKFDAKFRKLKNFHEITRERKKIARIWTLLNEKAIEEAKLVEKGKNA